MFEVGYQTLDDWWNARAKPWLCARTPQACWTQSGCDVFVVPTKSLVISLQRLMADLPFPIFGVQVFTPFELRASLFAHMGLASEAAASEDLICIADFIETHELAGHPIFVQHASKHKQDWLKTLGTLKAVGARLPPSWAELDQKLSEVMSRGSILWDVEQDLRLRLAVNSYQAQPLFNTVFFWGFECAEFACPNWLEATCKLSTQVHVCAPELPEDLAGQLGYSFCESFLGEAHVIDIASSGLAQADTELPCEYTFLNSIEQEAEAVYRKIINFLADPLCERIGVVVGNEGALACLIAHKLEAGGITFHDGLGCVEAPLNQSQQALRAWISWADRPNVPSTQWLIRQWRCCGLVEPASAQKLLDQLQQAANETLTTHIGVVADYLNRTRAVFLPAVFEPWPQQALWGEYWERLKVLIACCGISEWPTSLEARAEALSRCIQKPLPCKTFLNWAIKVFASPPREISGTGVLPWARVQLLAFKEVGRQNFSHLIVAGLNREDWEGAIDGEALDERLITTHKSHAIEPSIHGEGEAMLHLQKFWILNAHERLAYFKKAFLNLIRHPKQRNAMFFSIADPGNPHAIRYPSLCLIDLYEAQMNVVFVESHIFERLGALEPAESSCMGPTQCRIAYQHRTDPNTPFDHYSFCFKEPPAGGINLACRNWEEALRDPASVWMRSILGLQPKRSAHFKLHKALTQGLWVHDWLHSSKGSCVRIEDAQVWQAAAQAKAKKVFHEVRLAYQTQKLDLPLRWLQAWHQATEWAGDFIKKLAPQLQGPYRWVSQELVVPLEQTLPSDFQPRFPTRGRVDLVLSTEDLAAPLIAPSAQLHIIDFKVNEQSAMSLKLFEKNGYGLQLVLYGQMLQGLHPANIGLSIISTKTSELEHPQLMLQSLLPEGPIWERLMDWQKSGAFGQSGAIRDAYKPHRCYPLATIDIAGYILERKWRLTHPGLEYPK